MQFVLPVMKTYFEVWLAKPKEWRWRARRAGRIVAESGEGYKARVICIRSMDRFIQSIGRGHYKII